MKDAVTLHYGGVQDPGLLRVSKLYGRAILNDWSSLKKDCGGDAKEFKPSLLVISLILYSYD